MGGKYVIFGDWRDKNMIVQCGVCVDNGIDLVTREAVLIVLLCS